MHHSRLLTAACLCVALAVPTLEASECISMSARTMKKEAGLVFEGTVSKVEELENNVIEATMDVHRVWKGEAGKRATIHYPAAPAGPDPSLTPRATTWLKTGERFVVFTTNVTAEGRPKLAQDRAFWVAPCSGLHRPDTGLIKELGRSRKPKGA